MDFSTVLSIIMICLTAIVLLGCGTLWWSSEIKPTLDKRKKRKEIAPDHEYRHALAWAWQLATEDDSVSTHLYNTECYLLGYDCRIRGCADWDLVFEVLMSDIDKMKMPNWDDPVMKKIMTKCTCFEKGSGIRCNCVPCKCEDIIHHECTCPEDAKVAAQEGGMKERYHAYQTLTSPCPCEACDCNGEPHVKMKELLSRTSIPVYLQIPMGECKSKGQSRDVYWLYDSDGGKYKVDKATYHSVQVGDSFRIPA